MGCGVGGLGFEVWAWVLGIRFEAEVFGLWVGSLRFEVRGPRFGSGSTLASGFRSLVLGSGFRILGFGLRRAPDHRDRLGADCPRAPRKDRRRDTSSYLLYCNENRNEFENCFEINLYPNFETTSK